MAKDMKTALSQSLESERNAIEDRFAKADALLGTSPKKTTQTQTTGRKATLSKKTKPKAVPSVKVIRDSFSIPESDYQLLSKVKKDCMKAGVEANKSEIVRAGLKVLAAMNQTELRQAIGKVERIKTGRPKCR